MFFRHLLSLTVIVYVSFLLESVARQLIGGWFQPNFLIILIVFFNLSRGTRVSLTVAILAGIFRDAFSAKLFGMHIFAFVSCAYLTTVLKMYIYHVGSIAARLLLVFLVSIANIIILYLMNMFSAWVPFRMMFMDVLLPQALTTTVVAALIMEKIRKCASKLSV